VSFSVLMSPKRKLSIVLLMSLLSFLSEMVHAQPFRYTATIFNEVDTLKNVEFARAEWLNNPISLLSDYNIHEGEALTENRPLYMDIFLPRGDTLTQRPAVIFVHGGAFLVGSRHNDDMVAFCDSFARRGYVTATIDYRRGMGATVYRFFGIMTGISVNEINAYRAVYRASQDGRAAVSYLRKNAGLYEIDAERIFMVGSSAGAFAALNNLYLDQPEEIPSAALNEPSLGGLDFVGYPEYRSRADAVVALWGAIANPSLIGNESTPVFLIHGKDDDIVPFAKGVPLEGTVSPNPFIQFSLPETYGSYCIDTALNNKGIYHKTWFPDNKKHEFYGVDTGEFPPEGPNLYWDTIHNKIEKFLLERFQPGAGFEIDVRGKQLTVTSQSDDNHYINWDFGDGSTGIGEQADHVYQYPGEYTVTLTICNANLACDTLSKTVTILNTAASNDISSDTGGIRIYPNPVTGQLNISGIQVPFEVTVYDITGRKRISVRLIQKSILDISELLHGIYFLEIESEDTSVFRKIIKTD
jgi:acetyl esterase/lipase